MNVHSSRLIRRFRVRKHPLLFLLFLAGLLSLPLSGTAKNTLQIGDPLPAFALADLAGHRHRLAEFRGRSVALFFFCGCSPCHQCARLWAQVQLNGDLSRADLRKGNHISTVIVFTGSAGAARSFATDTGLDLNQTLLLIDPADSLSAKFHVQQCPRVFIVNPAGRLIYTNPDDDDPRPRLTPPAVVSRASTAWWSLPSLPKLPQKKLFP